MLVEYKAGKSRQPALVTTLTSIPRQQKSPTIEGRGFGFKMLVTTINL
ncbi:hypothetical protein [Alteromonas mediterranea]|nr:hypothetical protein [Alteromonas mediterranea]CAH1194612.1 hypothetical protein ISS312_02392 [Alteromonas mediterranea]|tara:strand:+ start:6824 stop:6967 length:144 start_codon:yes stop_codon:yes gene_type:complete